MVVTGLVLAGLLTAVHAATTHQPLIDLKVYRLGARAFLNGQSPYARRFPGVGLPYTYTPFSTLVFAPMAMLPWGLVKAVHTGASIFGLFITVVLVTRDLEGDEWSAGRILSVSSAATVVFFASEPMLQTLGLGQINLVLMGLIAVDLLALRSSRWAGVILGIAAGIKLTPLVFVLYLLALRRFRTAVVALVTAAATLVVGWALMPQPSHLYFTKLAYEPQRVGNPRYVVNQSLDGLWTRMMGGYTAGHHLWTISVIVTLPVGIWAARQVNARFGEACGMAVCAGTGLLVSPISWTHHWVWWLVPGLALALAAYHRRSRAIAVAAAFVAALFAVGPVWLIDPAEDRRVTPVGWQRPVAEAYVLAAIAGLAVITAWLVATRNRPMPPVGTGSDRDRYRRLFGTRSADGR